MTVDLVAKILRRGRSLALISSNVAAAAPPPAADVVSTRLAAVVDFTANARRLVGGDERSSFGAMGWGGGGGATGATGSAAGAAVVVVCKMNCCWVGAWVNTVYCVPPGEVHSVACCVC